MFKLVFGRHRYLFPKSKFLKELYRGVPLLEWQSLPKLIPQRRVPFMEWPGGSYWLECSHYLTLLIKKKCPSYAAVFFSRENFRFARDIFRKSPREFEKVPVKKKTEFFPWKLTSCQWQIAKKVPVKNEKCLDNFWHFARDETKSARDKPVAFYRIFFYHQLKLPCFTSCENFIGQSFIQNPNIYFFCTKKRGGEQVLFC